MWTGDSGGYHHGSGREAMGLRLLGAREPQPRVGRR